jgi:hypothetical protein
MNLDYLLNKVKDAVFDDKETPYNRGDSHGLIQKIEDLFRQDRGAGTIDDPRPASEDPLGDPADQLPEPYATTDGMGNVRSSRHDPLGDPADQERSA